MSSASAGLSRYSFTPGPWRVEDVRYQLYGQIRIFAINGDHVANVRPTVTNCEANALLISAAPDMHKALQKLKIWLGTLGNNDMSPNDAIEYVDDVLAKAEGKS